MNERSAVSWRRALRGGMSSSLALCMALTAGVPRRSLAAAPDPTGGVTQVEREADVGPWHLHVDYTFAADGFDGQWTFAASNATHEITLYHDDDGLWYVETVWGFVVADGELPPELGVFLLGPGVGPNESLPPVCFSSPIAAFACAAVVIVALGGCAFGKGACQPVPPPVPPGGAGDVPPGGGGGGGDTGGGSDGGGSGGTGGGGSTGGDPGGG